MPAKFRIVSYSHIEEGKVTDQQQIPNFDLYLSEPLKPSIEDNSYLNGKGERVNEQLKTEVIKESDAYTNDSVILPLGTPGYAYSPETQNFYGYYDRELKKRGWKESQYGAAAGADGEQRGYEKDGHYFFLGFKIIFDFVEHDRNPQHPIGIQLSIEYN